MKNRDENLVLRALTAAVEGHTQILRLILDRLDEVLDETKVITARLDEFHDR